MFGLTLSQQHTLIIQHDVIFCISGLQNPERREIRDKATDMGARYRQQWTDDATHLVAVFANAPKHLEMKGMHIILTEVSIREMRA